MSYKTWEVRWEGDLPGTPQQIWDGVTRHAGAWLWPITYEPRIGGAERGLSSQGGEVTAWDPPRHFATESGAPHQLNALDYRLEGSHLSYAHRGGVDESEFDVQYDACVRHTNFYYHSLGEYLGHFADREPDYLAFDEVPGSTADVLQRLGMPDDAAVGDEVDLGVVDYRDGTFVGVRAGDALIRVYGREVWGWPVGVAVHSFGGPADAAAWRKRLEVA